MGDRGQHLQWHIAFQGYKCPISKVVAKGAGGEMPGAECAALVQRASRLRSEDDRKFYT